ncbi:MAG: ABC transporter substrate-binding protein [Clostridiales bacterium]|nr:ABC transporter substrate-binding protein [Clostridiales bacterium]
MKRNFFYLISILLLCLALTACAPAPTPAAETYEDFVVVGFSQVGAESDWRNANTASMQQALSEENGYRLILDDAQQKQERQITAIRNFIHQGVDYIVLAPTTEKGWDTVLAEAKDAGIPVIIVDRRIEISDDSLFTCWIGSDFLGEGRDAVRWLDAHYAGKPLRIVHLQGNIGSTAQIGRTAGLNEGLTSHPEWELVYRETGDFTQAKGQELVEALLADGMEFDLIFSENDNMAYGAIDALKNAGLTPGKDVTIISFDASRHALELVMSGEISYDVECNPLHGPRVEAIIQRLERGQTPPKLTYVEETAFDTETITQSTLDSRGY